MRVTERTLSVHECGGEIFKPYQAPCFWDVVDDEIPGTTETSHVVVLDLVGALECQEAEEFHAVVEHLVERGERIIVVNLETLTRIDSAGLGALVRSYVTLKRCRGSMPIVNAPKHFREFVASMRFL